MTAPQRKRRLFSTVDVVAGESGFVLRLDGVPAKTPSGRLFSMPTRALAEHIADEWRRHAGGLRISDMPATRLAYISIGLTRASRAQCIEGLAAYADADLLCHRAESPAVLAARQQTVWRPLLDWAAQDLGLRLVPTVGVAPRRQQAGVKNRAVAILQATSDFDLAGLAAAAGLFTSLVLALALRAGRLAGDEAYGASRLDEAFQEQQWGVDPQAAVRSAALAAEADALEQWFRKLV